MAQFDPSRVKKVAVFTSGGDAPAMNAAIRASVRVGIDQKLDMFGICGGYAGLLVGDLQKMELGSVANIIQRGGTILKTGRCPAFLQPESRSKAAQQLRQHKIDALICIGGDGSFRGAQALWEEHKIPVVGLPATIDNDINGTDATIGFDTAVNTALEAIDRVRDTAASHNRLFIVEVMGRDSGFLATHVALAGGAEDVFIPESLTDIDKAISHIQSGIQRGKTSSILVAAEGKKPGRAYDLAEALRKRAGYEAKVCILGHIQRGGSPTAFDRILASRLGKAAIDILMQGYCNVMVGLYKGQMVRVDFETALQPKPFEESDLIELVEVLSH